MRDHQAAGEVPEPTQGGHFADVAHAAVGHQANRADALHGVGHHLARMTGQVEPVGIARVPDDDDRR
jgi:hypothetical protein